MKNYLFGFLIAITVTSLSALADTNSAVPKIQMPTSAEILASTLGSTIEAILTKKDVNQAKVLSYVFTSVNRSIGSCKDARTLFSESRSALKTYEEGEMSAVKIFEKQVSAATMAKGYEFIYLLSMSYLDSKCTRATTFKSFTSFQ